MAHDTTSPAVRPPSFAGRAITAVSLLVVFHLLTLAVAGALLAAPVVAFFVLERIPIFGFLVGVIGCWVAAFAMLFAPFSVRPPSFRPPGPKLDRDDAPELFAMIEALGTATGVEPPDEVYLSTDVNASVLDRGGLWSRRRGRVLVLGVPLVEMLTKDELRAVLAHELGHFAGGDTRLSGVVAYTVASFKTVAESTSRDAFSEGSQHGIFEMGLGLANLFTNLWAQSYAALFFAITRSTSQRQELAADALAARLAGKENQARALRKVAVESALYDRYLETEVSTSVALGAMPSDLVEGYLAQRGSALAGPLGASILDAVLAAKPVRADTHPTFRERLRTLGVSVEDTVAVHGPPASALFAAQLEHRAWLPRALLSEVSVDLARRAQVLPRAVIARDHATPAAREKARKLAAMLHPHFKQASTIAAMLAAVAPPFFLRGPQAFFATVDPRVPPREARSVGAALLLTLLEGALVEHGAEVIPPTAIGERTLRLGDETIDTRKLVAASLDDTTVRAELRRWVDRLHATGASAAPAT